MAKKIDDDTEYVCKCECGGEVRGTRMGERLFTVCMKCTPVVTVPASALTSHKDTSHG